MNTLYNQYDSIEKLIFDKGLRIQSLEANPDDDVMLVYLTNGHVLNVRISLFKALQNATKEALQNFRLIANGTGIHWPELDEDLSLKGFLKEFLLQKIDRDEELVIA